MKTKVGDKVYIVNSNPPTCGTVIETERDRKTGTWKRVLCEDGCIRDYRPTSLEKKEG